MQMKTVRAERNSRREPARWIKKKTSDVVHRQNQKRKGEKGRKAMGTTDRVIQSFQEVTSLF